MQTIRVKDEREALRLYLDSIAAGVPARYRQLSKGVWELSYYRNTAQALQASVEQARQAFMMLRRA
jgi:hypothetical protein